eukprot:469527_1
MASNGFIVASVVIYLLWSIIIVLSSGKEGLIKNQSDEYAKKYHPYLLLDENEKRKLSDEMLLNFRSTIEGAVFSGVFTDYTVLQREPYLSALYGVADRANTKILVNITQIDGNYKDVLSTISDMNGDWKVILAEARPNGGNYSITVQCEECINPNIIDRLYNITFGDVFYCAGQSNMQLDMHHTFNRNITYNAINNGKYTNIRYHTQQEVLTSNITYILPPQNNPQYQWQQIRPEITDISLSYSLDKFSAPCWYFAETLDDTYNLTEITIGLIDVAVGGSMIEAWIQNETVQLFCKDSVCPDVKCGGLYNGLVASYLNMTLKAYLWYQGEN